MLLYYINYLCYGSLLFMFLTVACAGYAHRVNARRADDDPKKRDFHPLAVLLAPITFPFFVIFFTFIFVLRAVLFGVILILFALALIGAREPFIFRWLYRMAIPIGNRLLAANTTLIKWFWKPGAAQPETQKSPYTLEALARRFA